MSRLTKSRIAAIAAILGTALLFNLMLLPAAQPAAAQTPSPRTASRETALANRFRREQNWFNYQTQHLAKAGTAASSVQTFIDNQNALGKNTASLVTADRKSVV